MSHGLRSLKEAISGIIDGRFRVVINGNTGSSDYSS